MKHLLAILTIALAGAAATAFADDAPFNFTVNTTKYTNQYYEGKKGCYFTIAITEGTGKLYITDFFNNVGSGNQSEALYATQMGVTRYGYSYVSGDDHTLHDYALNDSERIVQLDSYQYRDHDNFFTKYRNGYELGTFSAGDEVQIYLTNGSVAVSSNTPTGANFSNYGIRTDKLDSTLPVATLYLNNTQVNFGLYGAAVSAGGGEGGGAGTFGSPLPGGAALYVVAGLFALGFFFFRRKQSLA